MNRKRYRQLLRLLVLQGKRKMQAMVSCIEKIRLHGSPSNLHPGLWKEAARAVTQKGWHHVETSHVTAYSIIYMTLLFHDIQWHSLCLDIFSYIWLYFTASECITVHCMMACNTFIFREDSNSCVKILVHIQALKKFYCIFKCQGNNLKGSTPPSSSQTPTPGACYAPFHPEQRPSINFNH